MTNIHSAFSKSYAEARQKFLSAAHSAGLQVESHIHPEKGRDGEELAMDVVREGPSNAKQVLLISSACHGVEGYCGSGVQIDALRSAEWASGSCTKWRGSGLCACFESTWFFACAARHARKRRPQSQFPRLQQTFA
jgi:hypothetical protein